MANKVLLKKSSVGARVPTTSDLDYGELALNYADGKLYYKTSSNTIKSFTEDSSVVTLTGTQTLTNKTLTFPVVDNIKMGFSTTATAAGTTTLTSASNHYQRFTGSTTQTIVLPVTSTLATGVAYEIENASTGNLTVNSSGGNLVVTIIPGVTVQCMCIGTTLTTAADWDPEYTEFATITGTGSAVLSASPALTGTTTFANATSTSGFLAVGNASVTTNRIYATNGAAVASILGNNTFQSTSGLAGVSGTTTSAGSGHLGYFNGTVRAGVFGQIGNNAATSTLYAGYFSGRVGVAGDLEVTGNLTVSGTTTTINSTTLTVDDKNIELGSTASPTDVTADGGGITLKGTTDKTFNWVDATDAWTSSEHIALAAGKTLVVGGSSSGTTTITANATASGILTLPAATDTLVGKATTDTLTNKTLSSAVLTGTVTAGGGVGTNGQVLQSTGTGVQWATVSAGGGTTTNALTIGTGLSGTSFNGSSAVTIAIDSTVATLTGTQTLTNKSLTSPIITGTVTAGGGVGTNGQVLQSTGTGVQWATVSGGGYSDLVEISQTGITTSTTLYSASATTYRGAKYTIQITNSTAYAMYEFLVMHDGTSVYFPYMATAYSGDSSGNYQNYFHGDYLDSIAITKIQVGNTYHALNWALSAGNLVFSASCSSGTIDIKGTALLIKA